MAAAEGFAVDGLDRLADAPAPIIPGGQLGVRIGRLLGEYNYIMVHDAAGRIVDLRISGLRGPYRPVPPRHRVKTRRRGSHHLVEATLTGRRGATSRLQLMVDTGATTLALPLSQAAALGFRPGDLEDGWSETANGRIPVKLAELASVRVGWAVEQDVRVAFIADDKLAGNALLGMSFLERFRLTIDDERDQIILNAR